jgi:hypothetical protein
MRVAPSLRKELLNRSSKVHVQRDRNNVGMRQHPYGQAGAWASSSNQGSNQVLQASCLPQSAGSGSGTLIHPFYSNLDGRSNADPGREAAGCAGPNSYLAKGSQTQSLAHSLAEMRPAEAIPVYEMLPLDTVSWNGAAVDSSSAALSGGSSTGHRSAGCAAGNSCLKRSTRADWSALSACPDAATVPGLTSCRRSHGIVPFLVVHCTRYKLCVQSAA